MRSDCTAVQLVGGDVSPQEMFKVVVDCQYLSLHAMKNNTLPSVGETVIIGSEYGSRNGFRLAVISKIDGKNVIHTDLGVRFSTARTRIESTKKVGDRYWSMFNLCDSYDRALRQSEENHKRDLRIAHQKLHQFVGRLDPIADAEFISHLISQIPELQES